MVMNIDEISSWGKKKHSKIPNDSPEMVRMALGLPHS
jgi:hypothetical protein